MKYLRKFATEADVNIDVMPNVILIADTKTIAYNVKPPVPPLYVEAIDNVSVKFSTPYEYSRDKSTWISATSSESISVTAGNRIYLRARGLEQTTSGSIGVFTITGSYNVGGNIMSMAHGADYEGKTEITRVQQFMNMFADGYPYGDNRLIDASDLVLPATTLTQQCYYGMFDRCSKLVSAPKVLPATTLANYCYASMFSNCSSLVDAPELPATTLANNCYASMFSNCSSLVDAPELPATTMTDLCYDNMFYNCTNLVNAPALPATTLALACYRTMFYNCRNLVNAPALPATTLAKQCYYEMFSKCSSLVNAPELPATKLRSNDDACYDSMFKNCSSLSYVKAMFETYWSNSAFYQWLDGVAATGTFVKSSAATWDNSNVVPTGWTVETADA